MKTQFGAIIPLWRLPRMLNPEGRFYQSQTPITTRNTLKDEGIPIPTPRELVFEMTPPRNPSDLYVKDSITIRYDGEAFGKADLLMSGTNEMVRVPLAMTGEDAKKADRLMTLLKLLPNGWQESVLTPSEGQLKKYFTTSDKLRTVRHREDYKLTKEQERELKPLVKWYHGLSAKYRQDKDA